MSYQILKAPLIVDPDRDFLKSLENDPSPRSLQPWLAADKDRAIEILKTEASWVSCIVLNPEIGQGAISEILRFASEEMFGMKIYFLCEPETVKTDNETRSKIDRQVLEKPLAYADILDWVEELNKPAKRVRLRGRKPTRDADFLSIAARAMLVGGALSVDLYIRLREDRYICVVAAGDALDEMRLERYIKRGLLVFYSKKADQEEYVRVCENLSSMLTTQRLPESDPGAIDETAV